MSRAGVVVISPSGLKTHKSFQLDFDYTNNHAEYEALIIDLEMLVELKVSMVEVIGDSQLVLKQLSGEYNCISLALAPYFALAMQLLEEFDDVSIRHVPRDHNHETNEIAQIASGLQIPEDESFQMLSNVHDGICGAHQAGIKMRWLIRRHGLFWPSVLKDCIAYGKGCKSCQIHGPLQRGLASKLNSIVKPWPFQGWAIDLIVLPMEIIARSLRIAIQHNLQSGEYDEAMMLKLEDLEDTRLAALDRLQAQKLKIAKSYNKRVKGKNLAVGDLIWKAILPLGKTDHRFGKWSPNWEGPF
ncbi:hypothetical protein SLEP1_g34388 [Rubroshorea leprosula]|uniref:RNase H type-1 domain-containing protein n=1 Tax=Rubroshorea leprosula TaxID=152421 RepID=A0AAV5KJQ4_9ROSI|nr:hypothetical protein SLEP1_g34388 [Rubroshorea leprosula]